MQTDIRATIDDVRRVVNDCASPALDDLGLVSALQVMAAKLGRAGSGIASLNVQSTHRPTCAPRLGGQSRSLRTGIVQEGLTNVLPTTLRRGRPLSAPR